MASISVSSLSSRPFEIVVWGASGFTGRLVAEHIARDYQGRIKWAIAGRDKVKLEQIRLALTNINASCKDVPILVADAHDGQAVGKVLSQTKVVLAMAGPFSLYGDKLVEQSLAQGTHYCDITGEVPWVKRSLKNHDRAAKDKGVCIVHCCGYDSIPSDLGTFMMVDYIKTQLMKKTDHVYTLIGEVRGGVSGGTIASGMTMAAKETAAEMSDLSSDAYYLSSCTGEAGGTAKPAPMFATYIKPANTWAAPFIMETCNGRIVQLSNSLSKDKYGSDFKYTEMMKMGFGWAGWAKAMAVSAIMVALGATFALAPLRALAARFLPAPGQGPSEQELKTGLWTHEVYALTEEAPGEKPILVEGICGDRNRDGGYWGTSRMILEAGLCLALDGKRLEEAGCSRAGVVTASAAMGNVLIERLRAAGMTWEITHVDGKKLVKGK